MPDQVGKVGEVGHVGVGRPADSAALVAPVLAGDPENVAAWLVLARAMVLLGDHAEALRAAREAAILAPDRTHAHLVASEALRQLGRHPEAVDAAEQAVRLDPDRPGSHQVLALALVAGRVRLPQAWAAAQTAARLAPTEPAYLITCARAAEALGARADARQLLQDALRLDPLHPVAHHELARLSSTGAATGLAEAATGFRTALGIDPRREVSRTGLDLVLRAFLIRVAYLMLAGAGVALRVVQHGGPALARVAVLLTIAVPAGFAARFLVRLDGNLRGYLLSVATRGRQRAALAAEALAALLLLGAAVAPGVAILAAAAAAALTARILVHVETNAYRRSRGLGTRYLLSRVTVWSLATALVLLALLGLLVAATGGPAFGLGMAAVGGLLAAATIRAARRRA